MSKDKIVKNHCYTCGEGVTGNARPEEEVGILCGRCVAGMAKYVENRPDEYPVPIPPKRKGSRRAKDKKWSKKMEGNTLKDC